MFDIKPDTVVLLIVAAMNALTLYYTRRTEKNTNSMKDALVASEKTASHAEGKEEGRAEGVVTAAILAQGVVQGKEQA